MAQTVTKIVQTPIQSTTDEFYKFFQQKSNLLPLACGDIVQKVEFLDGNKSGIDTAGSLKRIYITPSAGKSENVKYKVADIKNASKKITFNVLEGAMLATYNFFNVTLEVTPDNTAKWTVQYQEKIPASQEPKEYLNLLLTANAEVDAYILNNPPA